ncbi:ADA2A [Acrasis kona]|uniref:ADA2A n=1 Tax=Acrasis kona TaxID=1008807 RepID=A0AAW2YKW4_9EUKA
MSSTNQKVTQKKSLSKNPKPKSTSNVAPKKKAPNTFRLSLTAEESKVVFCEYKKSEKWAKAKSSEDVKYIAEKIAEEHGVDISTVLNKIGKHVKNRDKSEKYRQPEEVPTGSIDADSSEEVDEEVGEGAEKEGQKEDIEEELADGATQVEVAEESEDEVPIESPEQEEERPKKKKKANEDVVIDVSPKKIDWNAKALEEKASFYKSMAESNAKSDDLMLKIASSFVDNSDSSKQKELEEKVDNIATELSDIKKTVSELANMKGSIDEIKALLLNGFK